MVIFWLCELRSGGSPVLTRFGMLGMVQRAQQAKDILDDTFPALMYEDVPSAHILSQVTSRLSADVNSWGAILGQIPILVERARNEVNQHLILHQKYFFVDLVHFCSDC